MKGYCRLVILVIIILAAVISGANLLLNLIPQRDTGRPYRVEAHRIANRIRQGEGYDLSDYRYITRVTKLTETTEETDNDSLVLPVDGVYYRLEYRLPSDQESSLLALNIGLGIASGLTVLLLVYVYVGVIRPFRRLSEYPTELAKGNLTIPLKEQKNEYFGKFLWGLDLLREKLEERKSEQLALQKQNKTMVLSLSHDIKTPLGVIELYAKALEKGLYQDEEKKKEVTVSIRDKCEDIRHYVDDIVRTSQQEIYYSQLKLEEFYLSELLEHIRRFYEDKLHLLNISFRIDSYSDCILSGDGERSEEVLQNIIENAVKYGDGGSIDISFSREEDCQLIHIANTGCTLSDTELPHIFDSFWRGSNVGSQSGSGLGLFICRSILRQMNGGIYGEIHQGTMIMTVVIPLA